MWNCWYRGPERDQSGSLWYTICTFVLDTTKIVGIHFSYNQKLKEERNFCLIIASIQGVLKLWKLWDLILEGKILIFKTLALSKPIFQAFFTSIPNYVVTEVEKMQKNFLLVEFSFKD